MNEKPPNPRLVLVELRKNGEGRPAAMRAGEARRFLGIGRTALRKLVEEGKIEPVRHPGGRQNIYLTEDLIQYLSGLKRGMIWAHKPSTLTRKEHKK